MVEETKRAEKGNSFHRMKSFVRGNKKNGLKITSTVHSMILLF